MPFPTQNSPPSSCYHALKAEGNYPFPQVAFFRNLVPPSGERGGEKYDLLYQNSVLKYEDDLEHQVFYILCDLELF